MPIETYNDALPTAVEGLATELIERQKELKRKLLAGEKIEFPPIIDLDKESEDERIARSLPASWFNDLIEPESRTVRKPIRIANAIIQGPLILKFVTFQSELSITGSQFTQEVDLSFSAFNCIARFEGSEFLQPISFRAACAKSYFNVSRCFFHAECDFIDIHVSENFYAESTVFDRAYFTRAEIAKSAFFRPYEGLSEKSINAVQTENEGKPVQFSGEVDFWRARIGGTAEFIGAQFNGKAWFDSSEIGGSLYFYPHKETSACFEEDVRFFYTRVGETAEFDGVTFKKGADFERIKVGGTATFRTHKRAPHQSVSFGGSARFVGAHIQGNIEFDGAQFINPDTRFELDHARVDGDASFDCDDHKQSVLFEGETCFVRTLFNGRASFQGAGFKKKTTFEGCEIKGPAQFQGAVFNDSVSFREANFRVALFRDELTDTAPKGSQQFLGRVDLRGFTYSSITAAWRELFDPPGYFDRYSYSLLEKTLRLSGYDREADNVYFQRRQLEAKQRRTQILKVTKGWASIREIPLYLFDRLQRWLFNYGVRPYRLLGASMLVVALGTYMFSLPDAAKHKENKSVQQITETLQSPHKNSEGHEEGATVQHTDQTVYQKDNLVDLHWPQALGMSFRLFIPIVEVPSSNQWVPSEKPAPFLGGINLSFAGYATLHRLAGAILVPLGVAALTGLIRRREKS